VSKVVMVGSERNNDSQTFRFEGATVDQVADRIATFMAGRGYRLESGERRQGVYGRGSAIGRAVLGPFARRHVVQVTVGSEGGGEGERVAVVLARGASGWSGGVFGARSMNQELDAVASGIQQSLLR
jgi:hypothetical protein